MSSLNLDPYYNGISVTLGRTVEEIATTLEKEFEIIQSDPLENYRYPNTYDLFVQQVDSSLITISNTKKNYLEVLNKLLDREGPRKFYIYDNDLEAVTRIFQTIEKGFTELDLQDLGLENLPHLLRKLKRLTRLDIRNNKIFNIDLLSSLSNLSELYADNNPISDLTPLGRNTKLSFLSLNNCGVRDNYDFLRSLPALQVLSLRSNKINDTQVPELLKIKSLIQIDLSYNKIDKAEDIVSNLSKLREEFDINVDTPVSESEEESKNKKSVKREEEVKPVVTEKNDEPKEQMPPDAEIPASVNDADKKPGDSTQEEKKEEDFPSSATGRIAIMATPVKVLLDVQRLSKIFYDFIADCEDNSEQFFGLFGRWGRGKTYLWNYLKKHNLDTTKYIPVEFHAWKYQDTPGLWAYLYGELNKKYFDEVTENRKGIRQYIAKAKRLLKLNFVRGKILKPLFIFLFSVIASIIVFLAIKTNTAWLENTYVLIPSLLGLVGVNLLTLFNYLEKYKNGAREVISQITSNMDFKSQLGLQHEIQEELKLLLSAWIPEDKIGKKRILLFIDDIDRCSEDKIIQIVDYIRVLINDEEIQSRITILAAIDERILINAIQNKYKRFVESKDNDSTYKELCREYMDKLFIAGLKLGPLTDFEKAEMLRGFTDRYLKIEEEAKTEIKKVEQPAENLERLGVGKSLKSYEPSKVPPPDVIAGISGEGAKETKIEVSDIVISLPENGRDRSEKEVAVKKVETADYSLEKWEQDFLKEIVEQNSEITPRSIRVYSYRYLLGKKLIEKPLVQGESSWQQWYNRKDAKRCFALKLFHYTYRSNLDELYATYGAFMKNYKDDNFVREDIYNYSVSLNQKLGSIIYQTLTMIVAY